MTDETPGPAATPDAPVPPVPDRILGPVEAALADAVREIERHVATAGWDGPVRVFALVRTARALEASPELADQLPAEVVDAARTDPTHLTSVEQEGLPPATDLEELLGGLQWPSTVDGAAVVVERVMLPPAAEEGMPTDDDAALAYLMAHPDRQDVRIAVGALRSGESWTALRTRAHDADDDVAIGPDLVPGLLEALRATFS
ncbi:PPA1309 family protein [Cellulomonas sp. ATA003]|uniref:PPA1309 family protein n=1 Tax=Cellulomonas sp. ATA003 TaxID=3073064 RepID=UPI002873737B|nr:PPA1309 family protein [Cellulomonas sp. ATA003]WNB86136.1 PPA1309 family protein [Cellulomonas sp. ATA003]